MTSENARYAIGIDLGTTNCVLGYAPLDTEEIEVKILEVPQLVVADTLESRNVLPSFHYAAVQQEAGRGAYDLPWASGRDFVVGEAARKQSADVPMRSVAAAKSWLAYNKVDRREPILPWNAPADEVPKISPVDASARYIQHLVAAWEQRFPEAPLKDQRVVLTVPASFDASARELTWEAARKGGLPEDAVLLEEPQAAVYNYVSQRGDQWRSEISPGDTLLVCDVGGGTTDFTLVKIDEENGEMVLNRVAVGNHILVGGDNMDLALAHIARELFAQKGTQLDPWQSVSLWHACRGAKEALLSDNPPENYPVAVLGRGSKLIGGTVKAEIPRDTAVSALADGFFPPCGPDAAPARKVMSGFRELGLPFESDTGITKHLASFLRAHSSAAGESVHPTHLLFNGGVFKSSLFRKRITDTLSQWSSSDKPIVSLERLSDLDFAAARGAAYYGYTKQQGGVRIRGGVPRSYYVGIETAGPAVPGIPRPLSLLCVVPNGMEEGTEINVPSEEIGLVVGEPAEFRFFSSSVRKEDQAGQTLPYWQGSEEIEESDSLQTELPAEERFEEGYVPVKFQSRITELGVFELWCKSTISDDKWKLEFSVRPVHEQA